MSSIVSQCPDAARWQALLDNNVAPEEELELSQHLETCAACQRELEHVASSTQLLQDVAIQLGREHTQMNSEIREVVHRFKNAIGQDDSLNKTAVVHIASAEATEINQKSRVLGDYEIVKLIGKGGMGIVYQGRDRTLNRLIAIKMLSPQLANNSKSRKRFLREARAAASVNHRNVVTIYGVVDSGNTEDGSHTASASVLPHLVMEFVDGESLQDRLDREGRLNETDIVNIGIQTAFGLSAAHDQGLIHRDVKPDNVLLAKNDNHVKITDFGLARAADDVSLTRTGFLAGTPSFMSPEQSRGDPIDERSDLFSLGSLLYVMCTGRTPFEGSTVADVVSHVQSDEPVPIDSLNPAIPNWLVEIIERLHAKDPDARFQSAREVAVALKRGIRQRANPTSTQELGSQTQTPNGSSSASGNSGVKRPPTSKSRTVRVIIGIAIVALVTVALVIHRWKPRRPDSTDHTAGNTTSIAAIKASLERAAKPFGVQQAGAGSQSINVFHTLAEAISHAKSGATIVVKGNGPFECSTIDLVGKSLTIRAQPGFQPVLILDRDAVEQGRALFQTDASLVLVGLELDRFGTANSQVESDESCLIRLRGGRLVATNCRFRIQSTRRCVLADRSARCEFTNCELYCPRGFALEVLAKSDVSQTESQVKSNLDNRAQHNGHDSDVPMLFHNCVYTGDAAVVVHYQFRDTNKPTIRLTRNTFVCMHVFRSVFDGFPNSFSAFYSPARRIPPIRVITSENVFDTSAGVLGFDGFPMPRRDSQRRSRISWLRRVLSWVEDHPNLYVQKEQFIKITFSDYARWTEPTWAPRNLEDWRYFWHLDQVVFADKMSYAHGPISVTTAKGLTAADFRLSITNPQTLNGKLVDFSGCNVDFLGPGKGLQKWRRSEDYRK